LSEAFRSGRFRFEAFDCEQLLAATMGCQPSLGACLVLVQKDTGGTFYPTQGLVYTARVYARKLKAEIVIAGGRRAMPLEWLDSFCMRNFTGSAEFDDTLPIGDGRLEAGSRVDLVRLAQAMSDWFTKRGKGDGKPVEVDLRELS
jgi:hypothetical protein